MTTYPFISRCQRKFIVPIYPEYHTELLPDSILRTESVEDFIDNRPNRNAIRKVYISRSHRQDMKPGDIVVFYRTKSGGAGHHTSVATTIGIIESVVTPVASLEDFIRALSQTKHFYRRRFKKTLGLLSQPEAFHREFPLCSFTSKTSKSCNAKAGKITTDAPRGFDEISDEAFARLIEISNANKCLIVN